MSIAINNIKNLITLNTLSDAELSAVDGASSNIQQQLDSKAPLASPALTGTPTAPTPMERFPLAPTPPPTTSGSKPTIKANEVIRIGRKRAVAP